MIPNFRAFVKRIWDFFEVEIIHYSFLIKISKQKHRTPVLLIKRVRNFF